MNNITYFFMVIGIGSFFWHLFSVFIYPSEVIWIFLAIVVYFIIGVFLKGLFGLLFIRGKKNVKR